MNTPERIQYKGYVGVVEYQSETHSFDGHVKGTRDVVTFHGGSLDELQREMAASLDQYLAWCKEHGIEPRREETADEGQLTLRALLVYFNRRLGNQNPARQGHCGRLAPSANFSEANAPVAALAPPIGKRTNAVQALPGGSYR